MSLLPDITSRLSHSSAVVRKKTIVCLYRLALVYPEALKLAWPKIQDHLGDDQEDSSVTTAAINVVCELGWRRPHDFLPLAPRFFELLVDSGNNWMAIKIIKLVCAPFPEKVSFFFFCCLLTSIVRNLDPAGTTADSQTFTTVDKYRSDHISYVITLRVYQWHHPRRNLGWRGQSSRER